MAALEQYADVIKQLFEAGKTHTGILETLQEMGVRRRSAMSVRRFCIQHNLRRKRLVTDAELERAVVSSIYQKQIEQKSHDNSILSYSIFNFKTKSKQRKIGRYLFSDF